MDSNSITCVFKLFAVNDTKQKLIGMLSFPVDCRGAAFNAMNMQVIPFNKCIDSAAVIVLSTQLEDQSKAGTTTNGQK